MPKLYVVDDPEEQPSGSADKTVAPSTYAEMQRSGPGTWLPVKIKGGGPRLRELTAAWEARLATFGTMRAGAALHDRLGEWKLRMSYVRLLHPLEVDSLTNELRQFIREIKHELLLKKPENPQLQVFQAIFVDPGNPVPPSVVKVGRSPEVLPVQIAPEQHGARREDLHSGESFGALSLSDESRGSGPTAVVLKDPLADTGGHGISLFAIPSPPAWLNSSADQPELGPLRWGDGDTHGAPEPI
jgi:hypothetical protein